MLTLLIGKDWVKNRNRLLQMIADDIKEEKGGRILMVPELISHDTERRLCAIAGDTVSRYAEVLSFTRLARVVADSVGHAAPQCLDNGGRIDILTKTLDSCLEVKEYCKTSVVHTVTCVATLLCST